MKHFSFGHHPFRLTRFLTFLYKNTCCSVIFLDLDMNRHPRNRGGWQGHQNPRPTRHTRNNALYEDLFDTSVHSIAPSEASIDWMPALATPAWGEPMDTPLPTKGVRQRLSDYARPVVQRQTTRVNAPLQRGANFKIDSHILGPLPTFHGLPSEDPYRHVDEFSQVYKFNQFHNVPSETAKMRFFPLTLKVLF